MSGSVVPYVMAAGGCALGAMLGLTVHMPLYYEAVYHLSASAVSGIAAADMVTAFRYVFAAAAAMMAGATLLMLLMEEKPLAGPAEMAE